MKRISSPRFIGRAGELAELAAGLERASAGEPAVFLVGGEAGVGKSRLLAELTARAREDGARVLIGGCVPLSGDAVPFLAIPEALRGGGDGLEAGSALAVFERVMGRLRELEEAAPLLLAVEDVHWADRSTLDLLAFVMRNLGRERLMIVATFREDELDARPELRAWVSDAARVATGRLSLGRFDRGELEDLLAGILGGSPPAVLASHVFARSEGNAFMAEELLAAGDSGAIPETLRDTMLARLDSLGPAARQVVGVAAVCGRRVAPELLDAAWKGPEDELDGALRDAVRRHILVAEEGRYAFRHALLQEAAYGELGLRERTRLHAACAEALERRPELASGTVAAELSHHWLRAGDEACALAAAVRAGMEAERAFAVPEALEQYERALALWDRVPDAEARAGTDRAEIMARAAAAAQWRGEFDRAIELLEGALDRIDEASEPLRAALMHERLGWCLFESGGSARAALMELQAALRLVPEEPPTAHRSRLVGRLALAQLYSGRVGDSRRSAEDALAMARAIGARREEAAALFPLGAAMFSGGEPEAGLERMAEARRLALEHGEVENFGRVSVVLTDGLIRQGRHAEALEMATASVAESRRRGTERFLGAVATVNAVLALIALGRWDEAEAMVSEALDELPAAGLAAASLGDLRVALDVGRGRFAEAHALLGSEPADAPDAEGAVDRADRAAELASWEGRPEDVAGAVESALTLAEADEDRMYLARLAAAAMRLEADRAERARARQAAGEVAAACKRAEAMGAAAAARRGEGPVELAAHLAAIAAERTRAEGTPDPEAWAAAVRAAERWGPVYKVAYARWRWAEALLASRAPRAEAVEALRPAYETARRLGAKPLLAEIEVLARRARIDLTAPVPEPEPEEDEWGLTSREREVLEHVAAGETNRQIAEALFISVKTAGVHVSSILRKLDASTRGEAAAIAHRAQGSRAQGSDPLSQGD